MNALHIVQGDPVGDRNDILKAAAEKTPLSTWVLPKNAEVGDEVVVYISGYGFFATARIDSKPVLRTDWTGEPAPFVENSGNFELLWG